MITLEKCQVPSLWQNIQCPEFALKLSFLFYIYMIPCSGTCKLYTVHLAVYVSLNLISVVLSYITIGDNVYMKIIVLS